MIDLNKHIECLLLDNDCVILPGLGGFVVHNEPAKLDEETDIIYPPFRSLGFNTQLTVNDGLLVQSLMQTFDTDYPTALQLLEEEINNIKKVLQDQGQWTFDNLGTLSLSDDGLYEFKPASESGIASPLFYGLDALYLSSFSTQPQIVKEPQQVTLSVEPEEEQTVIIENEEEEEEYEEEPSFWSHTGKSLLKYAAIFLGVIVLFFASSLPVKNVKMANIDVTNGALYSFPVKNAVNNVRKSFTKVKPVVKALPQQDTITAVQSVEKTEPVMAQETVETKPYYTIVLASQVKRSNAEYFITRLSKKGLDEGDIMVKGKMTRVVYSTYDTENAAYNALNRLKKQNSAFMDAWVMHVAN